MHIYFEFYVKVEKKKKQTSVGKKTSEYITALSAKKIQISFITTIQFIKLFFFFFCLIMYTLQEIKLLPQTFSKVTDTDR